MPSEIRHIVFKPPEVVEAIGIYYRRVGRAVPPGVVSTCGPERSGAASPAAFRMTIDEDQAATEPPPSPPAHPRQQDLVVEGAELAAALILFCRRQKIPLPANATKSLEVYGGQLCLAFTIAGYKDCSTRAQLRLDSPMSDPGKTPPRRRQV
jgi:hypothetical protein